MSKTIHTALQKTTGTAPHERLHQPKKTGAKGKTAAKPAAQPLALPEDIVTLSSSPSGSTIPSADKKSSQPVSADEKKALLKSPKKTGFSVYG